MEKAKSSALLTHSYTYLFLLPGRMDRMSARVPHSETSSALLLGHRHTKLGLHELWTGQGRREVGCPVNQGSALLQLGAMMKLP